MKSLKDALIETRPWEQEPGAEQDEDERIDAQLRAKSNRKDRMAQWKRQKHYPMPGEQKPGFAKSPLGENELGACVAKCKQTFKSPKMATWDPEDDLDEAAPPGFEKAVKAMKKDKSVDNPYAVAWSMKNKGNKPSDSMNESDRCDECGMVEGHTSECSYMNEADDDEDSNECPECGGPPGKHDQRCPLNPDNDMDEADELDDEDDMDTLGDEVDAEACPGCGSKPGDGINPKCDDPMGCGFWKEFKAALPPSREPPTEPLRSLRSMLGSPAEPDDEGIRRGYGEREGFETKHGEWIENPFWDESGRDEVNPEEHYGDAFTKSGLAKRLRWGESSDYDGLPLTESSMFDRFDTLVGHRSDGTFDDRVSEVSKLRSLVKKVVREAWSTYDPKTREETEYSVDDDEIKDLYDDKDEKVQEMKLSVAGPAFGASSSDVDNQEDGDEDYKVLAPREAPKPEKSGTRIKNKKKKS